MAAIVLDKMTKRFPDGTLAVQEIDLEIADGEFVILLGPSGCGKSTTLNMVAGLEDITSGELRIGGERINERAPKDRDLAMVFQSYALYPHMTVRQNIAFPLTLARAGRATIDARVAETARMLDLTPLLDRKPATLSGGERQRVAMGRAIVRHPQAFLMDEPLSNLDAQLRVQMQVSIARLQKQLGATMVYVTHDQTEAMRLGDRLVVMRGGVVQQVGSPQVLYEHPVNLFVAAFIGSPTMNLLPARLEDSALQCVLGEVRLSDPVRRTLQAAQAPREVVMGVRPEYFEDAALIAPGAREHGVTFTAHAEMLASLGADKYAHFALADDLASAATLEKLSALAGTVGVPGVTELVTRLSVTSTATPGEKLQVWFDPGQVQVFDLSNGRNLTLAPGMPRPSSYNGSERWRPGERTALRARIHSSFGRRPQAARMVLGAVAIRLVLIALTWSGSATRISASMASRYCSPALGGCAAPIAQTSTSVRSRRSPSARLTKLHARKAVSLKTVASVNGANTTTTPRVTVVGPPATNRMRLPTPTIWPQLWAICARRLRVTLSHHPGSEEIGRRGQLTLFMGLLLP